MEELKQFLLLMWKHYHLRKYRWFITGVEVLLPILIGYLLCVEGGKYLGRRTFLHNATIEPVYTANDFMKSAKHLSLVYTPGNKFTYKIIEKMNKFMSFRNITNVLNEQKLEEFLISNTNSSNGTWMGVVFANSENAVKEPTKLNYVIRTPNSWYTDSLFYSIDTPGPLTIDDEYAANGFAGIQLALDTAFIHFKNPNFNYTRLFQAFPYPEYKSIENLRSMTSSIICYVVIFTSLITSVPLINNIIEEKESGIKELMKLVGLKEWVLQASWFVDAIISSLISFSIVVYLLQRDFNGIYSAVILNVPVSIVWSCIILYSIANITFCFTFAAMFHRLTVASSTFILAFCFLVYLSRKVNSLNSWFLIRLTCLSPVGALFQGFRRIAFFENQQQSVNWYSLSTVESETEGVSLQFVFLAFIFDTFLYLLLSYYVNAINPGTFGTRREPLFCFEKIFAALRSNNDFTQLPNFNDIGTRDEKYFENPPNTLDISISITDLFKNFGSVSALKGVNLNVFKGEITALLGHNGAGKSTTMAILTGMMKPTAGSIMYKNYIDVLKQMKEFRKHLGLCPQENRLFPYLSVINHLIFFGMLKGASKSDAVKEAKEYLDLMEMTNKENSLSKSLSGGMKRKLCLAIALMGKVETLILDEPTSGMDVESRRKVWDLLLEIRGNRTIILSTHHMEEADTLGDRIAIMNNGTIVCHGTALFLKKVYDSGYEITISKDKDKEAVLADIIRKVVPTFEKKAESAHEIVYKLPLYETAKFPQLFRSLEEQKSQLGIRNMGVSCTSMEQVFLRVGEVSANHDNGNSRTNATVMERSTVSDFVERKNIGLKLVLQQFEALIWKKFLFVKRNILKFFFRVLSPTLLMMWILYDTHVIFETNRPINLTLSTYLDPKVMVTNDSSQFYLLERTVKYVKKEGSSVLYANGKSIIEDLLEYGRNSLDSFQKELLLSISYNSTHNLTLYNKFAYHSLPILINTISNIELELLFNENVTISAVNHPVEAKSMNCVPDFITAQRFFLFVALALYSADLSYYFSIFLSEERIDGFKHIQFMSNLLPVVYWLSNFIFDFVFFFLILFLRILLFKLVDDSERFLAFKHPFEILLLLLCGFIAGGLLFTYVVNFFSKSKEGSYVILLIINFVATILTVFFYYIQYMKFMQEEILDIYHFPPALFFFLKYLILLVPSLNYTMAFLKFSLAWCNNITANKLMCRDKVPIQHYLEFASKENVNGFLEEVIFMFVNIFLYAAVLVIIEAGYFDLIVNKVAIGLRNRIISRDVFSNIDSDVAQEKDLVHRQSVQPFNRTGTVLLAHGLQKVFIKNKTPFIAVKDVSFTVRSGECFGLLGVNGAGKSTCFRMLTGDLLPTRGDSSIQNIQLSLKRSLYLLKTGYCAQTNGFMEDLTGREMLEFIATLRGVCSNQLDLIVNFWLSIIGLEKYQNEKCGGYSGGNKRKLCTAMALIAEPVVVFLDEPTAGVDPVSRRKLYDVMELSKSSGQAVVLTSHSMEECETLCDRLTIMTKGQMKCIGTAQHLKLRFAQGFSILIKTHEVSHEELAIILLKDNMHKVFGEEFCNLKDEHKGLLYYQITNVSLKWSQLFEIMEHLKASCDIIDDYTVTDTSLEEVFMSLAKQAEIES